MAGAYKKQTDVDRGSDGKWTAFWTDRNGRKRSRVGFTSKAATLDMARKREAEEKSIREGAVDPGDRKRREAVLKPVADHVEDYRLDLLAKGDTGKHANHTASTLLRLLADASVESVAEIPPDQIQAALGRMKVKGRSARTVNHARGAIRAFATWLENSGRIKTAPRLKTLSIQPEKSDRRRERRALDADEIKRLLESTSVGPDYITHRDEQRCVTGMMTGTDRSLCYLVAMNTGFRAGEIASLTPERFDLGEYPTITVRACYSKRGKRSGRDDVQPIRRDIADALRPWLAGKEPGQPVFPIPQKSAQMLYLDLRRAGIGAIDADGRIADFHALRHTFITVLVARGINVKVVQELARHSTPTLTLGLYTHMKKGDLRDALEGD